jgi:hypothetical protein
MDVVYWWVGAVVIWGLVAFGLFCLVMILSDWRR